MQKNTQSLDRTLCTSFSENQCKALENLYKAVLCMDDVNEMHKFFVDLCSRNELLSMMHRWQIVMLLDEGRSYEEIIQELRNQKEHEKTIDANAIKTDGTFSGGRSRGCGKTRTGTTVSSTTISRVNTCYVNPNGGYATALTKLKNNARGEK